MMVKLFFKLYKLIFIIFSNSEQKTKFYRKYYGVKLGTNIRFTGDPSWGSEPYLIEIGNNVTITQNVSFFNHDGGVAIFRDEHPYINVFGRIKIGNDVFIGANTSIMPNVCIGNNSVIGVGSVVTKDIPPNTVAAGVPAKPIKSILDYKSDSLKKALFIKERDKNKRKEIILKEL